MNQDTSKTTTPTAAVVLIGNELLSGRTQDTNLAYIARHLAERGIYLSQASIIPDMPAVIVDTLNCLRKTNTYVFTTGGIGPTHDDITADCVAEAFGVELPVNAEAKARLMAYWAKRGLEPNDDRLRMARIPLGATLIDNAVSIAPGFRMDNVFVFAGVPRIMQSMFDSILPSLEQGLPVQSVSVSCNLGEGQLAGPLRKLQQQFSSLDLGSYPGDSSDASRVMLLARGTDCDAVAKAGDAIRQMITSLGGHVIDDR